MAETASRPFPAITLLLTVLFLVHLFSPLVENPTSEKIDLQDSTIQSSSPYVSLSDAYGHDFAGTTLSFDGLESATVREESALDFWISEVFPTLTNQTMGTPDLVLRADEGFDICWTSEEGGVYVGSFDGGDLSNAAIQSAWSMHHVDTVNASNSTSPLVDCALAVNENGRQYVLYSDGPNIKSAHVAFANSVYSELTWQKITILYDVHPTHFEMVLYPDQQLEYAVFRDVNGALWELNYSGNYWSHSRLDSGPVGESIEMQMDDQGMVHLLYTTDEEVRLIRYDGTVYDRRVLVRDSNLTHHIGMGLDTNAVEQIATSTESNGVTTLQLLRSLLGQDQGRINPVSFDSVDASIGSDEGVSLMADINLDGFDDFLYADPYYSSTMAEVGRVSLVLGSSTGLLSSVQTLEGNQSGQRFGSGLTVADFNADGYSDVAVGSPGWNASFANGSGDNGIVEIYLGGSSGISQQSWWNLSGNDGDGFGWKVEAIAAMNGDEYADLAVVAGNFTQVMAPSEIIHKGQVSIFKGNASEMNFIRNITQDQPGTRLGQSLSGSGDLNGDGFDDLLISNAANFESFAGFPKVQIHFGSLSGLNGSADQAILSNIQGKMFGYTIDYIGDVNSDGYDDMMFSELFNGSNNLNQRGKVWLYHGSDVGIQSSFPNWTRSGESANDLLGRMFASAGDVNEDGYDDVLLMKLEASRSGKVELHLGSPSGLNANSELLATGNPQQYLGLSMSTLGDFDGDGLSELSLSSRNIVGQEFQVAHQFYSERDWESTSFTYNDALEFLDLSTSSRGEASMLLSFSNDPLPHFVEHVDDGTASGVWADKTVVANTSSSTTFAYSGTSSGRPLILSTEGGHGLKVQTTTSYTALEQSILSTGTMGAYLGSALDSDGHQHLAHAVSGGGSGYQILTSVEDDSGWSNDQVTTNVNLDHPIAVLTDDNDATTLLYRDSVENQLSLASNNGVWTISPVGDNNSVSEAFSALYLPNGDLAVALISDTQPGVAPPSLALLIYNRTSAAVTNSSTITTLSDLSSNISLAMADDSTMILSTLTSTGVLNVYERQWNHSSWLENSSWRTSINLSQPTGSINSFNLDLIGGSIPALAVRADASSDVLYVRNDSLNWTSFGQQPISTPEGAWDLSFDGEHFLLMTSVGQSNLLTWNSLEANESSYHWNSLTFGDVTATGSVGLYTDSNETLHLAIQDSIVWDVEVLRLYPDADRDLVFDLVDELPYLGDQWSDNDSDGYGDNGLGPLADSCPSTNAPSSLFTYGCLDYDNDGYSDSDDVCNDISGDSWIDRKGCRDYDQDGWSNNDVSYFDGDVFIFNWKLAFDSDGDGYGDNSGPDCCITAYRSDNKVGDLFPYNPSQYKDSDGDGWGDNSSDLTQGDACEFVYGESWRDRNGCVDSDKDGASDPSSFGGFEWDVSFGADAWPDDGTQWADSDGDGFGDNGSEGATNPDRFPLNIAAAEDNDSDGYPDKWTDFWNGTLDDDGDGVLNFEDYCGNSTITDPPSVDASGCNNPASSRPQPKTLTPVLNNGDLVLDGCPGVTGNSTSPSPGCPDSDGDGWMNSQDAFPTEPTQWLDFDGDGFGDNSQGFQADECPTVSGVFNGTSPFVDGTGYGCRFIDDSDEDGDFVPDAEDLCKGTDQGLDVNSVGCADNQLDDDEDLVKNDADLCPQTPLGETVDSDGCSEAQLLTDDDMDNVAGPSDLCPDTLPDEREEVDANGCSASQRDSDNDTVSDLDDQCPDTPANYPVLSNGCTDEDAFELDLDGDGFAGAYTYTLNEATGLRENQSGDDFPTDKTQWFDQDGDGYGDNALGNQSDACPEEKGTSFVDFFGCLDDGDGYRDEFEPPGLAGNPTQWEDADYDGLGDNINGTFPDLCPGTKSAYVASIDENGCHPSQLDSDGDGISDDMDNCPFKPLGEDGYTDGCPRNTANSDDQASSLLDSSGLLIGSAVVVLLLVVGLILIRRRGNDFGLDDDDDDDDWGYEDEEEEEDDVPLSFLNKRTSQPTQQRSSPSNQTKGPASGPPKRGPTGSPKSGPSGGPPMSGPGKAKPPTGPSRNTPRPRSQASNGTSFNEEPPSSVEPEGGAKVRKAKLNIDLSIFEDWQTEDRNAAADWVKESLSDGENERTILMQLQQTGWSAPQSRAIFNIGRSR
jgi:hypothetical protein|tara:strand:+ start:3016 stop:9468 length:6453 start_codon:yes stop_codon:yes gene_type:complete